jgi:hypothetical protein
MCARRHIDISGYSYDEFISFMFDNEVVPSEGEWHPWFFDVAVTFDASRICEFYTTLFRQPDFLLEKYSKASLEQGFWAIHGSSLDCSAFWIMWNEELPFSSRSECVRSMSQLFRRLFAREPLETSVPMWWDSLCYEWHCGNRDRDRGGEDLLMQDVIFETISDLLKSDSTTCQGAALHGLGHLHHPKTQELVDSYLAEHPSLNEECKAYALAVAKFEVL